MTQQNARDLLIVGERVKIRAARCDVSPLTDDSVVKQFD